MRDAHLHAQKVLHPFLKHPHQRVQRWLPTVHADREIMPLIALPVQRSVIGGEHVKVNRSAASQIEWRARDLASDLALDVPLQGIVAAGRERGIDQIDLLLPVEDAELDAVKPDDRKHHPGQRRNTLKQRFRCG